MHVFKRAFAYFPHLPLGFPGGFLPFWDLTREDLLLVNLIFYELVRLLGCGPIVGPFPFRLNMGSIRGEGTPPKT